LPLKLWRTRMCHTSGVWWPPSEYSVTVYWMQLGKSHKSRFGGIWGLKKMVRSYQQL